MNLLTNLSIIGLLLMNNAVWAYGGGGSSSTKACAKPKFSEFIPAEKAEVKPGSDFSFVASANTYPGTLKVTVKDQPITLSVDDKNGTAFKVSGKLPKDLTDSYARINITGEGANKCKGSGGWLVKIIP